MRTFSMLIRQEIAVGQDVHGLGLTGPESDVHAANGSAGGHNGIKSGRSLETFKEPGEFLDVSKLVSGHLLP